MTIEEGSNRTDDLSSRTKKPAASDNCAPINYQEATSENALSLIHKLQVRQIELERQNEELKRARREIENSLTKRSDLFEFAPVGLFIIDLKNHILEVNMTGAALLGMERRSLLNKRFEEFVDAADRPIIGDLLQKALKIGGKQTAEIKIPKSEKPAAYLRIETIATEESASKDKQIQFAAIDITKSRRAEERLRTTLESVKDGFFACNEDWKFVYVNAQAERILGIRREDVIGKSHWEIFPLTLGTNLEREYRRAAAGEVRDFENFYEPWGRWFHNRCFPRKDGGMSVYFEDITEHKKADEALQQSEEKFRLVSEFTYDWETWISPKGDYIYISPSCERITGHKSEEFIKSPRLALDIIHTDDREAFEHHQEFHLSNNAEIGQIDYRIVTTKGEIRLIVHFFQPVLGANGDWLGRRGSNRDITGRKLAEEALHQLNEELEQRIFERTAELRSLSHYSRSLIEASLDALVTISPEGEITDVNEATEIATGRTRGELIGTNFSEYFTDPDSAEVGYHKVLLEGRVRDYPLTLRHASGKTIDVLYNAAVYRNEEGELQGVFAAARDITELKRAEAALREANETLELRVKNRTAQLEEAKNEAEAARMRAEWLAKLPEENPNPIMRASIDGTVIYRNPTSSRLAGWEQTGEGLPAPILSIFNQAIRKGQRTMQHAELGDRIYSILVVPITDRGYANIYGLDITERELAVKALADAIGISERDRSQLEAIFEAQNDSILIYDAERIVQRANKSFIKNYGFNPVGLNLSDIIKKVSCRWLDGRPLLLDEQPTPRALRGEKVTGQRFMITRSDGVDIAVETSSGPIRIGDRIIGSVTVWRDITERAKAEELLRLNRERAEIISYITSHLLESDNPHVMVKDLCLKVMDHLNCHAFFNYLVDGTEGRLHLNSYAGISEEIASEIEWLDYGANICGSVALSGCRIVAENIPATSDQRTELVKSMGLKAYACHPLMDDGRVIGTLSFGSRSKISFREEDLSMMKVVADEVAVAIARIKMEGELRKAKNELEIRVDERTAQLQEAKENLEEVNRELKMEILEHERTENELIKAKEAAEAATVAKAAFMANMSHEIRTPLNAIIGMISILQSEDLTPEQRDLVEVISSGGDALLSVINQILDFSRLERERIELENQALHLPGIIEEALDLVTPKAAEKKLNLAYVMDKKTPAQIIGDASRIRQVLINLLDNAVKFTEKGEVVVLVSSKPAGSIYNIQFAVKDTGMGIPLEKMDVIFEPFIQVDYSITKKYGGAGLGLAISERLAKLMGGDIWLESKVGAGSTFYFNILAEAIPGPIKAKKIQPKFKGKRILIVEDNKTNQRILRGLAKEEEMIPIVTASQKEALRLITSDDKFDIAVLEMDAPEIDGLGLGQEMRNLKKNMPLVKLTYEGKIIHSDIFNSSLAKPIKPAQFYNILTNALSEQITPSPILKASKRRPKNSQVMILLAEDNNQSQKVMLQMLNRLGLGADLATTGLDVLEALDRRRYDIILMDVRMPRMSGLDAARIIRQRWPENGPIIIAITAFGLEGDRELCLDAGMDDYLSKPVKLSDLQIMLAKHMHPSGIEKGRS